MNIQQFKESLKKCTTNDQVLKLVGKIDLDYRLGRTEFEDGDWPVMVTSVFDWLGDLPPPAVKV